MADIEEQSLAMELAQAVLDTPRIGGVIQAMALHVRGVVRGARGDRAAAASDIDRAIALSDDAPVRKIHMLASRARLAESNEEALRFVCEGFYELARLGEGTGAEIPLRDVGIPVLLATREASFVAEARRHLAYAKARLERQASRFESDDERALFWEVPEHRRILALAEGER